MKKPILLTVFIVLFCFFGQSVSASLAPPQLVVNHETEECAIFYPGDECMSCSLVEDWEIVDSSSECPSDYTEIGELSFEHYICEGRKTQFCCTVGHSGALGDCDDVVVNQAKKQCAFIEDINECEKLSVGWQQAEMDVFWDDVFWGQVCPSLEYEWVDDIECVAGKGDEKIELMDRKDVIDYILYRIVFAVAVAASLVILWFLFRRKSKK